MHAGRHNSNGSERIDAQVCRHRDVSEMRIIVLGRHLRLEPGRVLFVRTSRLTLLGSLRHSSRLERPV